MFALKEPQKVGYLHPIINYVNNKEVRWNEVFFAPSQKTNTAARKPQEIFFDLILTKRYKSLVAFEGQYWVFCVLKLNLLRQPHLDTSFHFTSDII